MDRTSRRCSFLSEKNDEDVRRSYDPSTKLHYTPNKTQSPFVAQYNGTVRTHCKMKLILQNDRKKSKQHT